MKIHIRERNIEISPELRIHVERRLHFALGHFTSRIGAVIVRFSEQGDQHKRCQIDVGLRPRRVRAEDIDADLFAAVNNAADRVARSVSRTIERELEFARSSTPHP